MLRYSVGVGVGVMRVSGRCFVALLARRVFMKIKGIREFYLGPVAVAIPYHVRMHDCGAYA